ncbi:DUF4252 domain-containing protein [Mangrovimonas aestuarii]|uniref:DUF4252 domain-containing protein n=1 Tax=Mangrovimonas aestuarii TaxID=3018443 RepID=UPI002378AB57|nr:DUF4252 domain-containing protein [Mangrovimonas aestuarii]
MKTSFLNSKPKIMNSKLILFVLALIVLPFKGISQNVFDKYSDNPDVTYVSIKPKMFQMLAKIDINTDDPEAQQYLDMVNSITSFKTLVTDNMEIAGDIVKWVQSRTAQLEELMEVKDEGIVVKFYVKEGRDENHVEELLMFVNGLSEVTKNADVSINGQKREVETVVISMTGDIDLNQISKLTQQMNIPGGEHLEKDKKK